MSAIGTATSTPSSTKSLSNQGQFSSRIHHDPPHSSKAHQPGRSPGPREFHAKTAPPGSAPKSKCYPLNPDPKNLPRAHANGGDRATSGDVNAGQGRPDGEVDWTAENGMGEEEGAGMRGEDFWGIGADFAARREEGV
ncbi:hypothetical protein P152DRAFT_476359 [Eremomyces bilateralis CBS 781.70]|uniref:Uncharacterized protein n=1 Tax=Eremomyces bilateralis CBS 781.70 TaxID=1392243 RepID=A0A6G1FUI7_9PEZI|nr:uncharacterized protein P152DRAFT_476359 [Eremomyces bilateralis CBS 781.70]KAF1809444.1 hypothetical protein P152DRAFT_476359 [Eremomyces bilateralis CBS 781.70]